MKILFLCVANSARSQLAEGLAKKYLGAEYEIQSAGSIPCGYVQPLAIQVLQEEGIDISKNTSKFHGDLPKEFLENLDYIVTLCAEESCPVLSTKAKRLHWPISDPVSFSKENQLLGFREAREKIKELLKFFTKTN